jgi:hypothetical protein
MKYGSVSKLKNSTNTSINKGTIKLKNTIEKEKTSSSYRQGSLIITGTKFRTSKNSRKYFLTSAVRDKPTEDRNFSGERGNNLLLQNYINSKQSNNKYKVEEGNVMELMKRKIQKKKDKLKTNILNFSNPFNQKFPSYKLLETSIAINQPVASK